MASGRSTGKKKDHRLSQPAAQQFDWAVLALAVGLLLRLKSYLEFRPLWVDECWSAIEIVNRSFWEILRNENIFAVSSRPPTLFVLVEKLMVEAFGNVEWALRLPPLIFSLISVYLFYILAKNCLSARASVIAMWLFALSGPLVQHAAEAKRYSSAVFGALLLLVYAVRVLKDRPQAFQIMMFGVLGSVMIWFSRTTIFTLAAILLFYGSQEIMSRRWRQLGLWALSALLIGLSFAWQYFGVLKEMIGHEEMRGYFSPWLDNPSDSLTGTLSWLAGLFLGSLADPGGLALPWLMLLLMALGAAALWRLNRQLAVLSGLPIGLTLLAALTGNYPFHDRLILFLAPLYYLFLATGFVSLYEKLPRRFTVLGLALGLCLFYRPVVDSAYYLTHSRVKTENRNMLAFFDENYLPGDRVYLNTEAEYPFYYYAHALGYGAKFDKREVLYKGKTADFFLLGVVADTRHFEGHKDWLLLVYEYILFDRDDRFKGGYMIGERPYRILTPQNSKKFLEPGRTWVLLSQQDPQILSETDSILNGQIFTSRGKLLLEFRDKGVTAHLYQVD